MSKQTKFIFTALHVVAWLIFVGLCIEAGALLVNFVFSLFRPDFVQNLYEKLDLSEMYARSKWAYFNMYGFILAIAMLKAWLFYEVIRLMMKMDLTKPFSQFVSRQIMRLSYVTFSIGLLSYIAREVSRGLVKRGYDISTLDRFWADSQAYILMAAVIYVIAIIFDRGVALQEENDLTV
jgi:hypothetical protein